MTNVSLLYINGFAVLVLLLTLRNYRQKFKYICCEEKVFIFFILATMSALIIESALENLWGVAGSAVHVLLYVLQTLDYLLSAAVPTLWLYYCLLRIFHITNVSRRVRTLLALPAALFAVVMLIGVPAGFSFSISADNGYSRGFAYISGFIVGYLYMVAALTLVIIKRKTLNYGEMFPYLMVPVIPMVIGMTGLTLNTPFSLIWVATSLVILEIQMLILNNQTNIDHLTSLNNRMALDNYGKRIVHESHSMKEPFGLIMIDIDDFKKINDEHGHIEGDRALKSAADILRECFAGKHFIARYGGDEFTVVLKNCDQALMDRYLEKLEAECVRYNQSSHKQYDITLSVGASVFQQEDITDFHTMFMRVDRRMYMQKNAKKCGLPGTEATTAVQRGMDSAPTPAL